MSKQLTLTDFDAVIGLYNGATRYCDACKNLNCLVPRCDDRDVSRGRARDHVNPVLRLTGQLETRFLSVTWLVVRITWWLIVIHMVEIALWALFFWWQKCLPDVE